jgi:hypothetical protein
MRQGIMHTVAHLFTNCKTIIMIDVLKNGISRTVRLRLLATTNNQFT